MCIPVMDSWVRGIRSFVLILNFFLSYQHLQYNVVHFYRHNLQYQSLYRHRKKTENPGRFLKQRRRETRKILIINGCHRIRCGCNDYRWHINCCVISDAAGHFHSEQVSSCNVWQLIFKWQARPEAWHAIVEPLDMPRTHSGLGQMQHGRSNTF